MKTAIKCCVLVSFISVFLACNTSNKEVSLASLTGYFVKNNITFDSPVKTLVIKNQKDFDIFFGEAKTMNNVLSPISFDANAIGAIITEASHIKTVIKINSSQVIGDKLIVNYEVVKGKQQTYTATATTMFNIPIDLNVTSIEFKNGDVSGTLKL